MPVDRYLQPPYGLLLAETSSRSEYGQPGYVRENVKRLLRSAITIEIGCTRPAMENSLTELIHGYEKDDPQKCAY